MSFSASLDKRVIPQLRSTVSDEWGGQVDAWINLIPGDGKMWAGIKDLQGRDFFAASAVNSEVTTRITCRIRTDITPAMRILHGSTVYEVMYVMYERDRETRLMCKRV